MAPAADLVALIHARELDGETDAGHRAERAVELAREKHATQLFGKPVQAAGPQVRATGSGKHRMAERQSLITIVNVGAMT